MPTGAGTFLFDLAARDWSTDVVAALEIDPGLAATDGEGPGGHRASSRRRPRLRPGLAAGTPVVGGGGDQAANGVGVGAVDPGVVALSLGTSGVVFAATDRPLVEPDGRVHALLPRGPGPMAPHVGHALGGGQPRAGSATRSRPGVAFDALDAEADEVPAGSDGLVFLPYLTGERSPHPDPLARGAFVGLTVTHERRHLARAVLEGVAFGLRDGLDQIVATGIQAPSQVRASGGGIASELWRQILADVLGAEIATVSTTEGAAFGAALLAAVGAGWYASVEEAVERAVRIRPVTEPGPDASVYAEALASYRALYPALRPIFHAGP